MPQVVCQYMPWGVGGYAVGHGSKYAAGCLSIYAAGWDGDMPRVVAGCLSIYAEGCLSILCHGLLVDMPQVVDRNMLRVVCQYRDICCGM